MGFWRVCALLSAVALAGASAAEMPRWTPTQLADDVLAKVRASTVFIEVEFKTPSGALERASGSGFFIHESGWIITNAHVVTDDEMEGSPRVTVTTFSGMTTSRRYEAEVRKVGEVETLDLALLKVDASGPFTPLMLVGDLGRVQETQECIAIGFPYGRGAERSRWGPAVSVRAGSITRIMRDNTGSVVELEHNANIDAGNSGGPLVTAYGEVIGVVNAVITQYTFSAMAVPSPRLVGFLRGVCPHYLAGAPARAEPPPPAQTREDPRGRLFFGLGNTFRYVRIGASIWSDDPSLSDTFLRDLETLVILTKDRAAELGAPSAAMDGLEAVLQLRRAPGAGARAQAAIDQTNEAFRAWLDSEAVEGPAFVNYWGGSWVAELVLGLIVPESDRESCAYFNEQARELSAPAAVLQELQAICSVMDRIAGNKPTPDQEKAIMEAAERLEGYGRLL